MAKQITTLAPLLPHRADRIADEALSEVYLRGGFNVEPRDGGEWWTRKGEETIISRVGSAAWNVMTAAGKWILWNAFWALKFDPANGQVTNLYPAASTENVAFTNGADTATSINTRNVGELILVGAGGTSSVYRVTAVAGTTITLDRVYEGATATVSCRFMESLAHDASATAQAYEEDVDWIADACVFEQLVEHNAADSHAASPATNKNRRYLIICSAKGVPVAIDLNNDSVAVLRLWFYNTALATPASIPTANAYGTMCATYAGRLFIARAPDANKRFAGRTFWYSRIGDLLYWHSGIAGQTATGNYATVDGAQDDFAALEPLGNDLIGHRQRSQTIITSTGTTPPFTTREIRQGIGIHEVNPQLCVQADGGHFIWTDHGPAVFDGSRVTLIAREMYRALAVHNGIRHTDALLSVHRSVHADFYGRIYWRLVGRPQGANANRPHTRALGTGTTFIGTHAVFAYDYRAGVGWIEDRPNVAGGGTLIEVGSDSDWLGCYFSQFDGTIVRIIGKATGYDAKVGGSGSNPTTPVTGSAAEVVQARADTPWLDFGMPLRKHLQKVEVTLRALTYASILSGGYPDSIEDVWAATSDELWLRMEVFRDWNATAAAADVGVTYTVSAMLALAAENNQQMPGMLLIFSPKNVQGRTFMFRFTNDLTAAAMAAGYKKAPFRISKIVAHWTPTEGDQAQSDMTTSSISA